MRLRMASDYDIDFMLYVHEKLNKKHVIKHCGIWDLETQKHFLLKSMEREKYNIIYELEEQIGIFAWNEDSHNIYLHELLILKKFQKTGVGTLLLDMLMKRSDYFNKKLEAQVFKSNKIALEFYLNKGFEVEKEGRSHYIVSYQKRGKQV